MQSKTRKPWLVLLAGIIIAAGCNSNTQPTNENFIKGLNDYYANHDDCLFPQALRFPYEVSPGPDEKKQTAQMDALTEAGLLKPKVGADKSMGVHVYTLTPVGERAAGRFCYGHREITSIDSFTPPAKGNSGLLETQVTYHYKMMDVPVWARTDKMQSSFPVMAKALSGQGTDTAKLANAGAGWQIPN